MTLTRRLVATAAAALIVGAGVVAANPAWATPPGIPSASTARSELATLTVAASTHTTTYNRDLFPHWHTVSGACNTRETVLKRDGTNVVVDSSCAATSGSWFSPYDGATWTLASDLDIDHVVPLKNAWISGAWAWTTSKRESFANDLSHPQLIAVTDNVNQAKGDKSPDQWLPSRTSYRCTYVRMWVAVKYTWVLTVTSAEKSTLTSILNGC